MAGVDGRIEEDGAVKIHGWAVALAAGIVLLLGAAVALLTPGEKKGQSGNPAIGQEVIRLPAAPGAPGDFCFRLNADGTWQELSCVEPPAPTATASPTATATATSTATTAPTSTATPAPSPTATQAPTGSLVRFGDWGYTTTRPASFMNLTVYDAAGVEVDSTHRENISPYCAFGDPNDGVSACTAPTLPGGTYRVEAEAHFADGSIEEAQHLVTVAGPPPTPSATATASPTPAPSVTPPAGAVTIPAGANWASFVSAYPEGQTFSVAPGTHRRQDVQPKTGQSFICAVRRTCVMDGEFAVAHAFRGAGSNVTVRGLVITRYATSQQRGAIDNCYSGSGSGWTVDNVELTWNAAGGVYLGTGSKLTASTVTYNSQIGVKACGSNGLVQGNVIAWNNSFCVNGPPPSHPGGADGCTGWGWEGGGSKFVKTNGLRVLNNLVHDNCGPGLWSDIENVNELYEGNVVYSNSASGIFHEISYKALIRGNLVGSTAAGRNGNGLTVTIPNPQGGASRTCAGGGGAWGGAEITVNNSSDVEVTGNTVDAPAGRKGLLVLQQDRGQYLALRDWFHDNLGPDGGCVVAVSDYRAPEFFAGNNFGTRC